MIKRNALFSAVLVASSTPAHAQLEEIIVTATKQAESMQDVPVSMQALSGESLDELGVDNFGEYAQYLPNVVWTGRGPGQAEIYIRGAATEQSAITVSSVQGSAPSVALYLDEQPVSFGGRNLDVYAADLERIEVLAGPQGTLFGASSQSGTVRLITKKPEHEEFDAGFKTGFSSTKGGDPSSSLSAYINMPVNDWLALRAVGYSDRAAGWIDNKRGSYSGNAEVMHRNQIAAGVDPNATFVAADNAALAEDDFNTAQYTGSRLGASILLDEDWSLVVQHTEQQLDTEGAFEYDANLAGESSVNRFAQTGNEDEFGLTTWTLEGRMEELDVVYTGGYLDREVSYLQDYTGYTNGGGYQAYYICTGGSYSAYTQCFDPTKQYVGETTNERQTHELRFTLRPEAASRISITGGMFIDKQKTLSDGEFLYFGARDAGFSTLANSPGTITSDGLPPAADGSNIVSVVDGVTNAFARGPDTVFTNSFTRRESQLAFFGEVSYEILEDTLTASFGARNYDIEFDFKGATGSSFGCKGAVTPCDGTAFDNDVTARLAALGAFNESGDLLDLTSFFDAGDTAIVGAAVANGTLSLDGLGSDGVMEQSDTIYRASLDWQVSDDLLLFAVYSEGFRPQTANRNAGRPAANQAPPFQNFVVPAVVKTDELDNYEIGIKSDLLDGSLRLNATAYHTEISDLQSSRFDPANIAFLVFVENIGDAKVTGLDADFIWAPTNALTLSGAIGLVDNELSKLNPQLNEVIVKEGSRLPFTPEVSANIQARYDFTYRDFDAYVRGGVTYTGSSLANNTCDAYAIEDQTALIYGNGSGLKIKEEGGFCGAPFDPTDPDGARQIAAISDLDRFTTVDGDGNTRWKAARYKQQAYTLLNLAVGVEKDSYGAEFFIDNVTDEAAQLQINTADYTPRVTTNRPRTVGLRFNYQLN